MTRFIGAHTIDNGGIQMAVLRAGNAGMTAESINTTATVTLEKTDAGFTITKVHLDVTARIPGAEQAAFETAANNAKAGCPISRLLKAEITMDAKLEAASGA